MVVRGWKIIGDFGLQIADFPPRRVDFLRNEVPPSLERASHCGRLYVLMWSDRARDNGRGLGLHRPSTPQAGEDSAGNAEGDAGPGGPNGGIATK